eukprot:CAMPEP_0184694104 /NCGR_PEP_ID=MMETSP0313-20130426/2161_1 /TAXON_ID=2792 /ORGANISM="Porphyridium aerugineum, Strain SAG 1380-2" /LENGTH=488 /DNA_ID=CAMNT_0027152335 /DNA_START=85 /DNA_END=1551 /DNA_ORIENTATION=-
MDHLSLGQESTTAPLYVKLVSPVSEGDPRENGNYQNQDHSQNPIALTELKQANGLQESAGDLGCQKLHVVPLEEDNCEKPHVTPEADASFTSEEDVNGNKAHDSLAETSACEKLHLSPDDGEFCYSGPTEEWMEAIDKAEEKMIRLGGYQGSYEKRRILVTPHLPARSTNSHPQSHFVNVLSFGDRSNPTLIILPGWASAAGYYGASLGLADKFRTHIIDWLGVGASSRPDYPLDMNADESEDWFLYPLHECLTKLFKLENLKSDQQVSIVAHSLGGYLASVYAIRHPEHIHSLVLVSPIGLPEPPANKIPINASIRKRLLFQTVFSLWAKNITPMVVMRALDWLHMPWLSARSVARLLVKPRFRHLLPEQVETVTDYFYTTSVAPGSGEYAINTVLEPGGYARKPLCDRLPELSKNISLNFLYGENDWVDYRHAERVAPKLGMSPRIYRVVGAGHNVFTDNSAAFIEVVSHCFGAGCEIDTHVVAAS